MGEKQTNYRVVRELLLFASATEGDISSFSKEDVSERLQSQGIDPQALDKAAAKRLQIIRNRIEAAKASGQAQVNSLRTSWPVRTGFAFAARADGVVEQEDLELLERLAQPDIEDDGTQG
jgi:hypothetical protein